MVLDKHKKQLMPCTEKRARLLLSKRQAMVHRMYPFTIRLKYRIGGVLQHSQLKIDPGSKTTGLALLVQGNGKLIVKALFHLQHRGYQISKALTQRREFRRRRRNQLWYRPVRFNNRVKRNVWLPPSLQHRVDTTISWVNKLYKLCPIDKIAVERVKFDTQLINNPDISGKEYQQGTLLGYELREYLLYKYHHTCVYCNGISKDSILEVDHVIPRSKGGSSSIRNLVIACHTCNSNKNNNSLDKWQTSLGSNRLDTARHKGIKLILSNKIVLQRDMAAVTATRNKLFYGLIDKYKNIETGTGGMTKYNRKQQGIPKDHCLDAVCVGEVNQPITDWQKPVLEIKCSGRGSYKRTRLDKYGFPRGYLMRHKQVFGFQTGDMVRAEVPKGKYFGNHTGRVAVRASGSFNIQTADGVIQGISHRYCKLMQHNNGYGYLLINKQYADSSPRINRGVSTA